MKLTHPVVALGALAVLAGIAVWTFEARKPVLTEVSVPDQPDAPAIVVPVEHKPPAVDLDTLGQVEARWRDAERLASSTSRMALPPIVADLQAQRRALEELELGPCGASAADHLKRVMDGTIDVYMAFLAGDKEYFQATVVQGKLDVVARERKNFEAVRATCAA